MPRFFVNKENITDEKIFITGEDAHHIARSLRMAVGEIVTACDGEEYEYQCKIEKFSDDKLVECSVIKKKRSGTEPPFIAHLYQALPKGEKFDTIIQKAVECGVYDIIPFESERCIVKAKPEAEGKKTDRRCRIAEEAAKQSGRGRIPRVYDTESFSEALKKASGSDLILICYENQSEFTLKKALESCKESLKDGKVPEISIFIGSEGGFSEKEVNTAVSVGAVSVGLGKRILRTETASAFALACMVFCMEL